MWGPLFSAIVQEELREVGDNDSVYTVHFFDWSSLRFNGFPPAFAAIMDLPWGALSDASKHFSDILRESQRAACANLTSAARRCTLSLLEGGNSSLLNDRWAFGSEISSLIQLFGGALLDRSDLECRNEEFATHVRLLMCAMVARCWGNAARKLESDPENIARKLADPMNETGSERQLLLEAISNPCFD